MSSIQLMGQHKKLVWFPFLNFIALIGIVAFFAMPVFTEMNVLNFSEKFPELMEAMESASENRMAMEQPFIQTTLGSIIIGDKETSTIYVLFFYLVTMVLATFVNVAFYSEIMQAFNGQQVSLGRCHQYFVCCDDDNYR
jgi:hypothetical protein